MQRKGGKKRIAGKLWFAAFGALLVAIVAVWIDLAAVYTWFIFSLNYMLTSRVGKFQTLDEYTQQLMLEQAKQWPVPPHIKIPPQPFQEMEAANFSYETFKFVSNYYSKPIIIRGLFKGIPASEWTPESLAEHFKERPFVIIRDNRFGVKTTNRSGWATVREVYENITRGGHNYIFNANFDYPDDISLYDDLQLDRLGGDLIPVIVQFFLGLAREGEPASGSPLHAAVSGNLNIQLHGIKNWTMIDPQYARYLNPYLLNSQFAVLAQLYDQTASLAWSNFPRYTGQLHPGDAIFIPPWWNHEVRNVPGSGWQTSVAVRFGGNSAIYRNNWLYTLLTDFGVRDKPCWPGFRMFCVYFMPSWRSGKITHHLNKRSDAGLEGANVVSKKDEKESRDLE